MPTSRISFCSIITWSPTVTTSNRGSPTHGAGRHRVTHRCPVPVVGPGVPRGRLRGHRHAQPPRTRSSSRGARPHGSRPLGYVGFVCRNSTTRRSSTDTPSRRRGRTTLPRCTTSSPPHRATAPGASTTTGRWWRSRSAAERRHGGISSDSLSTPRHADAGWPACSWPTRSTGCDGARSSESSSTPPPTTSPRSPSIDHSVSSNDRSA